jgi:beta-galactosidase
MNLPNKKGEFNIGDEIQTIMFPSKAKGRYFCLEALSTFKNTYSTGIAELDVLDRDGKPISHQIWTIAYVNSEELTKENGGAENAIDGQTFNYWHSAYNDTQSNFPLRLVIDLGKEEELSGFRYVPIGGNENVDRIKDYEIYFGNNLIKEE